MSSADSPTEYKTYPPPASMASAHVSGHGDAYEALCKEAETPTTRASGPAWRASW
jgi:hypothetical protein